jgi:CRISPR-associated protein Cas1
MLNEFSYCPRRCYFEWLEGEFVECEGTLQGRSLHRRLEMEPQNLSELGLEPVHAREISLFAPKVGITCRIDLLVGDGKTAIPVEYKNGKAPDIPDGAFEPDRVQVCAQGLVLRENGFVCREGKIFFLKNRKLVDVNFDDALL